jgi:DNA-directed RNA polymerase specialized sigma24 family protein
MNGWSYAEIAQSLDISADLVGVWLQRNRERLRKSLTIGNDTVSEVAS